MGETTPAKTERNEEMTDLWLSDPDHLTYSYNKLAVRYGISPARIGWIVLRTLRRRAKEARDGR